MILCLHSLHACRGHSQKLINWRKRTSQKVPTGHSQLDVWDVCVCVVVWLCSGYIFILIWSNNASNVITSSNLTYFFIFPSSTATQKQEAAKLLQAIFGYFFLPPPISPPSVKMSEALPSKWQRGARCVVWDSDTLPFGSLSILMLPWAPTRRRVKWEAVAGWAKRLTAPNRTQTEEKEASV